MVTLYISCVHTLNFMTTNCFVTCRICFRAKPGAATTTWTTSCDITDGSTKRSAIGGDRCWTVLVLPLFIVRNFLRRIESPPRIIAELGQSFRKSNVRDETANAQPHHIYRGLFYTDEQNNKHRLTTMKKKSCCGMAARTRAMVSHARGPEFESASGLHPPCHSRNTVAWSYTSRL